MKDGDIFLERLRIMAERQDSLRRLYRIMISPEYEPDWLYWAEWLSANLN